MQINAFCLEYFIQESQSTFTTHECCLTNIVSRGMFSSASFKPTGKLVKAFYLYKERLLNKLKMIPLCVSSLSSA